ncbi:glycosyltransferase family 4 protein [Planctomicrobium sp. SH661]|uniref:glycosyltransferase family 4 protein n=1 Tax=Planctomicrobium sp. SH661 TaxID=3448124 RepID=UPI003F5B2161
MNQTVAPLRIGLIFEYGSLNGGEFSMLAALDQLVPTYVDPVALCLKPGPLVTELGRRGIRTQLAPELPTRDAFANWCNDAIASFHLELLHANSLSMARQLGEAAPHLNRPTSAHIRDIMKLSRGAVQALNQHRFLAAVSHATRTAHVEQGIQPERLITLYNGVDGSRFRPAARTGWLHREFNLPPQIRLAATIGQICLRKGQNDLAAAAVLLRETCPDLHFLLVGERHSTKAESLEFDAALTETFREAGMEHRLHRLGFRNDISTLLTEIDLLIHPARQEPLGRVLLEAAACGVPIVATNVGGTPEILKHGESAWLVPPARPDAIASGVETLLSELDLARALGAAARRDVLQRFSIESAATALLNFWRGALNQEAT